MTTTRETIEAAFSGAIPAEDARAAVDEALGLLDRGEARLAEPGPDGWTVNGWLKEAILLLLPPPADGASSSSARSSSTTRSR